MSSARRPLALAALLLAACGAEPASERAGPPNLVLVIGDDVGYADFGFMGSPHVKTPHLDRLAREGTVFPTGYTTASTCRPSLRTLLTGVEPLRFVRGGALEPDTAPAPSAEGGLLAGFETLPRLLARAGYASFQGGKFWEGTYREAGFTHGMQEDHENLELGGSSAHLGRTTMAPLFEFIDAHAEGPFFVWFAPVLPHLPHDAPAEFEAPYRGMELSRAARLYYANVTRLDAAIGALVAHLEDRGLRERTLVVYVSDNGWDQAPDAKSGSPALGGSRGKSSMHDLGFRTPIVFHAPGLVPAGAAHDELVSTLDLVPTLLDYAGVEPSYRLPGRSLRGRIEGGEAHESTAIVGGVWRSHRMQEPTVPTSLEEDALSYWFFVRTPRWHYFWSPTVERDFLYDLDADPREEQNVASREPLLAHGFRGRIASFREELRRPLERRSAGP